MDNIVDGLPLHRRSRIETVKIICSFRTASLNTEITNFSNGGGCALICLGGMYGVFGLIPAGATLRRIDEDLI